PFFLYTAFTTPHFPMQCPEDEVARQRGRYRQGWDHVRRRRFERMRSLGILDRRWRLPARDSNLLPWTQAAHPAWEERRMEVYAAMVERMDRRVGDIVAQVRAMGQEDNTLFLFLSDNGGSNETMNANNTSGRVPDILKRSNRWQGDDPNILPGPMDTYQSVGAAWASASNAPFRRFKSMTHEGGIATPLIAAWGSKIAQPGRLHHHPGHIMDLLPTCLDAAGGQHTCEGRSLLPALTSTNAKPHHEVLCFEHEGNQAIRQGNWKLVRPHNQPWELYDLAADRTETRNLAPTEPQRVAQLESTYRAWMQRCGVEPWPLT
ncbi:sulfatase-like hydrolase/transferase, partial [Nostoc sp. NIES-2111]